MSDESTIRAAYATLEVDTAASPEEIRESYLTLLKVWHPDRYEHDPKLRGRAEAKTKALNVAFALINDAPFRRAASAQPPPPVREAPPQPASEPPPREAPPPAPPLAAAVPVDLGVMGFRSRGERSLFVALFLISAPVLFLMGANGGLIGALFAVFLGGLTNGAVAVGLLRAWRYLVGTGRTQPRGATAEAARGGGRPPGQPPGPEAGRAAPPEVAAPPRTPHAPRETANEDHARSQVGPAGGQPGAGVIADVAELAVGFSFSILVGAGVLLGLFVLLIASGWFSSARQATGGADTPALAPANQPEAGGAALQTVRPEGRAPFSVATVTLGNAIGEDKKVSAPTDIFGPQDTIYASVETAGQGYAKLRALWTFVKGEKTAKVDETTIEIDATGPATNEFHVRKPSGWPAGSYEVAIFLGDASTPVATKQFRVTQQSTPALPGGALPTTGAPRTAISYLEEATRAQPQNAEAWEQLGMAYDDQRDRGKACRAYVTARILTQSAQPTPWRQWLALGERCVEAGNLSDASIAYRLGAGLAPEAASEVAREASRWLERGEQLRANGNNAKAAEALEFAWCLAPSETARLAREATGVRARGLCPGGRVADTVPPTNGGSAFTPAPGVGRPTPTPQQPSARLPEMAPSHSALAKVVLDFEHDLESGVLRIEVDGVTQRELKLGAEKSGKLLVLKGRKGIVHEVLEVAPGHHRFNVQVSWDAEKRDEAIEGDLPAGVTRGLELRFTRSKKDVALAWK